MSSQRIATTKVAGTWAWFFQRLSAVLLIVLLTVHIYLDHYAQVGADITVSWVHERMGQILYIAVDWSMLAMIIFHGLNGSRTILFDFDMFVKRKKAVDIGLWILGIAMLIWGIIVLLPFIEG
jgi:succinate dehydrogenase / fumarate reductase membrane anchor subunit